MLILDFSVVVVVVVVVVVLYIYYSSYIYIYILDVGLLFRLYVFMYTGKNIKNMKE